MDTSNSVFPLTCSAGVIARDSRGWLMLVKRADDHTWGIPGGRVEENETWAQAAERECLEETGWRVRITGIYGVNSNPDTQRHIYPSGRKAHFMSVAFSAQTQEKVGEPSDECEAVEFFPPGQLPEPLFLPDAALLESVAHQVPGSFIN